jgi:hypothetical protein
VQARCEHLAPCPGRAAFPPGAGRQTARQLPQLLRQPPGRLLRPRRLHTLPPGGTVPGIPSPSASPLLRPPLCQVVFPALQVGAGGGVGGEAAPVAGSKGEQAGGPGHVAVEYLRSGAW